MKIKFNKCQNLVNAFYFGYRALSQKCIGNSRLASLKIGLNARIYILT